MEPDFPAVDAWILRRIDKMVAYMGEHRTLSAFGEDGTLLAAVAFDSFTPYECCIHLAVGDERGVTPANLKQVFSTAFLDWGLERLTALTPQSNMASRSFLERVGFEIEGRKRCAIDGEDELVYGMLKSECRWLK